MRHTNWLQRVSTFKHEFISQFEEGDTKKLETKMCRPKLFLFVWIQFDYTTLKQTV